MGRTNTLGINAAHHDSAACLVRDGIVLAAAEEERCTHVKHAKRPIPFSFTPACAGKRVEAVNPASTLQECSGAGARVQQSLRVRTHVCTHCGLMLDRDVNAARNLFWRGQRLRGFAGMAGMPAALNREPVGL